MVCAEDSPHEQLGHFHFSDACIAPVFKRNSKRRARECAARFNFQQMQTISKVKSAAVAALCESINCFRLREAKEARSGSKIKRGARLDDGFHCRFECRR